MNKTKTPNRISIPGRLIHLLLHDDEFFREVSSYKKMSSAGIFPKYDQWLEDDGFHMTFALAGYSKDDLDVSYYGQELRIRSSRQDTKQTSLEIQDENIEVENPIVLTQSKHLGSGAFVRGIARRNFNVNFFIDQSFDVSMLKASMKDGLLHILIPNKQGVILSQVEITVGE